MVLGFFGFFGLFALVALLRDELELTGLALLLAALLACGILATL
ncbi:hypothetical protein JNUCC0626_18290 [Lentzea sp. JNUCC 0626]